MPLRSVPNTIEALRLTLLKLEQTSGSAEDSPHLAELKRILLTRIADLEAADAIAFSSVNTAPPEDALPPADPAGLPPTTAAQTDDPSEVTEPDLKVAS